MDEVFISERQRRSDGTPTTVVTRADGGYQAVDEDTGSRFLVLTDGERYSVDPGRSQAERLEFGTYAVRLARDEKSLDLDDPEFATTQALLAADSSPAAAQLQWRLGLPLMVFILTLMAMPLSRVNPRQGRFAKLLPAIFLYVAYLSLLLASLDAITRGAWPAGFGMWPIHAAFLVIGLAMTLQAQRKGMSG
jgi:lipopolysaccharide export system permease protein